MAGIENQHSFVHLLDHRAAGDRDQIEEVEAKQRQCIYRRKKQECEGQGFGRRERPHISNTKQIHDAKNNLP